MSGYSNVSVCAMSLRRRYAVVYAGVSSIKPTVAVQTSQHVSSMGQPPNDREAGGRVGRQADKHARTHIDTPRRQEQVCVVGVGVRERRGEGANKRS